MSTLDLSDFQPVFVALDGSMQPMTKGWLLPSEDLFSDMEDIIRGLLRGQEPSRGRVEIASTQAAFTVGDDIAVIVDCTSVRASHMQSLLSGLVSAGRQVAVDRSNALTVEVIDPTCALTLLTHRAELVPFVTRLWGEIRTHGLVSQIDTLLTPSLYGNKIRLSGFLAGIAATKLATGTPVLDLMAGTGIVSRLFAERHPVWTNDANPYAALLSRCQGIDGLDMAAPTIIAAMRAPYLQNQQQLEAIFAGVIEEEARFLHGDLSEESLSRYRDFAELPAHPSGSHAREQGPYRLATDRYANVYFGIAQCVEIDSLRAAIDSVVPEPGRDRNLCLGALLIAAVACATGPHFAQPPRLHSLDSMRTMVERRARSVSWEFDLTLARLANRPRTMFPFIQATQLDWREALGKYISQYGGKSAAVYLDPPYSKLQYSRYYHVLNVILEYNYPSIAGVGRYPPLSQRFSSPLEFQPGRSRKELEAIVELCAQAGFSLILSYGSKGFVAIDALAEAMAKKFTTVEIFSERVRHHSQGKPLRGRGSDVIEHVIVGSPESV